MNYRIRPGVVLLRICDADLLAATRAIWEQCPAVRPIPRMWAASLSLMEKGRTSEDVIHAFTRLFQTSEEDVNARLGKAFETLYHEGYLVEAEDEP